MKMKHKLKLNLCFEKKFEKSYFLLSLNPFKYFEINEFVYVVLQLIKEYGNEIDVKEKLINIYDCDKYDVYNDYSYVVKFFKNEKILR